MSEHNSEECEICGGFREWDCNDEAMIRVVRRQGIVSEPDLLRLFRKVTNGTEKRDRTKLGKQRSARGKSAAYGNGRK